MAHTVAVGCVDNRLPGKVLAKLNEIAGEGEWYPLTTVGGVLDVAFILKQLVKINAISRIEKVVLMIHEDCRGYQVLGKDAQVRDLISLARSIQFGNPAIKVEMYNVHLDGEFEVLDRRLID